MNTKIKAGDRVRSFDFSGRRDVEGEAACYVEGVVVRIVRRGSIKEAPDCDRYEIKVDREVFRGLEYDPRGRMVYPPVNGTPTWLGDVTDGVEKL